MIYPHLKQVKDVFEGKAPKGHKRSSRWPAVRKHHLAQNPTCVVCGDVSKLEVHHIVPFHVQPELELEPTNLITMCESTSYGVVCHLYYGHLGNYKNINPNVVEDAAAALKILTEANK